MSNSIIKNTNTYRILAENRKVNNNTWITGLNNNDVIIGPSGAGKTRGYVIPNIMNADESMIVADTKGSIHKRTRQLLQSKGFKYRIIDFTGHSVWGYNPLDFIKYDERRDKYSEQDIKTVAAVLAPIESRKDPFWDYAARMYLESIISYVLECLPKNEHNMVSVLQLFRIMGTKPFQQLFKELEELNPKSYAVTLYQMYRENAKADKMHASIKGILAEKLSIFALDNIKDLTRNSKKIDFKELGKQKTIIFLTISDTDRSMDRLINLFYTQALHELCNSADKDYPEHRLDIPVRLILDDFAANACIPDFDQITSVIRSREISVSIILQSLSQINSMYGMEKASTILNNCDHCLYLGGQDADTAKYISIKANKSVNTILNMPLDEAWLFERGSEPERVEKYRLENHEEDHIMPIGK